MPVSLTTFIARRLAAAVAVIVGASALTFVTFRVLRPESFDDTRPLPLALLSFLDRAFLHLDLGRSRAPGHPEVSDLMIEALPADLSLLGGALVIGTVAGLAGGAVCALRPRSLLSRTLDALATLAVCAPVYWVGLMALYLFSPDIGAVGIPFLGGQGTYRPLTEDPVRWLRGLLLPWLVLAAPLAGMCLRMMRVTMQESLDQDFTRTALAKGLRRRTVIRRHAVPAGASPVIALAGVTMAMVVTNAILIERTFNIPGVLRLTTRAMSRIEGAGVVDFELLQGIVITGALFVVAANLLADTLLGWLDPRIRE
jgi:peptide/nickel transport system permease protein